MKSRSSYFDMYGKMLRKLLIMWRICGSSWVAGLYHVRMSRDTTAGERMWWDTRTFARRQITAWRTSTFWNGASKSCSYQYFVIQQNLNRFNSVFKSKCLAVPWITSSSSMSRNLVMIAAPTSSSSYSLSLSWAVCSSCCKDDYLLTCTRSFFKCMTNRPMYLYTLILGRFVFLAREE